PGRSCRRTSWDGTCGPEHGRAQPGPTAKARRRTGRGHPAVAAARVVGRPGTGQTCGANVSRRGGPLGCGEHAVGDRLHDQSGHSLRLLPSGPDRVREAPVRRRPPRGEYHASGEYGQGESNPSTARSTHRANPPLTVSAFSAVTTVTIPRAGN